MTRLEDAFDDLIAQHPQGDPDAILAAARDQVAADRSQRRTRYGLAAAAVVLALAALAATVVATRDDPDDHVRAGKGPVTTTLPPAERTVRVAFTKGTGAGCKEVETVERTIPGTGPVRVEDRVAFAMAALLDGPTAAEVQRGLTSPFDGDGLHVRSVERSGGLTTIDLDQQITSTVDGASTGCGSDSILAELSATLSDIEGSAPRRITIDGDPDAFWYWLGIEPPREGPFATTDTFAPEGDPAGYAVASVLGVTLRIGPAVNAGVGISRDPAASAYAIGTDLVVFQGTEPDVDVIVPPVPPVPSGEIRLWAKNEGIETLVVGSGADEQVLLDAGRVDGSAQALVALRSGDTPDTTRERLVLVDLETRKVQEVVDMAAWESGHLQARLLSDGDVIGLISGEGQTSVVRWTSGSDEPVWSTPAESAGYPAIAVRGDRALVVDTPPGGSGSLRMRPLTLETGALGEPTTASAASGELWCSDWYDRDELSCARNGSAGAIDEQGRWRPLTTPTGAVVTASR